MIKNLYEQDFFNLESILNSNIEYMKGNKHLSVIKTSNKMFIRLTPDGNYEVLKELVNYFNEYAVKENWTEVKSKGLWFNDDPHKLVALNYYDKFTLMLHHKEEKKINKKLNEALLTVLNYDSSGDIKKIDYRNNELYMLFTNGKLFSFNLTTYRFSKIFVEIRNFVAAEGKLFLEKDDKWAVVDIQKQEIVDSKEITLLNHARLLGSIMTNSKKQLLIFLKNNEIYLYDTFSEQVFSEIESVADDAVLISANIIKDKVSLVIKSQNVLIKYALNLATFNIKKIEQKALYANQKLLLVSDNEFYLLNLDKIFIKSSWNNLNCSKDNLSGWESNKIKDSHYPIMIKSTPSTKAIKLLFYSNETKDYTTEAKWEQDSFIVKQKKLEIEKELVY